MPLASILLAALLVVLAGWKVLFICCAIWLASVLIGGLISFVDDCIDDRDQRRRRNPWRNE